MRHNSVVSRYAIPIGIPQVNGWSTGPPGFGASQSPYRIVFGKSCHLPLELEDKATWVIKKLNFDCQTTKEKRIL